MTLKRQTVLYGLSGLCAVLAALLAYQLAAPLPDLDAPVVRLKPRTEPAAAVLAVSAPAPESFAEIDARALFAPDRRGIAASGDGSGQAPDIALVGIIADGQDRLALIKTPASPLASAYRVGATISGWRVIAIAPDRLVIGSGPARSEIRLDTNRAAKAPVPVPNLSNSQ